MLREVFNGIRRFDDMRERTGIPRQVLANRLAMLVERGVLRRAPYREPGARVRHEYRLTEMGLDLYPMLVAVREWGDRYLADPEGSAGDLRAPRLRRASAHVVLSCDAGHETLKPREVVARPGPGAHRRRAAQPPSDPP